MPHALKLGNRLCIAPGGTGGWGVAALLKPQQDAVCALQGKQVKFYPQSQKIWLLQWHLRWMGLPSACPPFPIGIGALCTMLPARPANPYQICLSSNQKPAFHFALLIVPPPFLSRMKRWGSLPNKASHCENNPSFPLTRRKAKCIE